MITVQKVKICPAQGLSGKRVNVPNFTVGFPCEGGVYISQEGFVCLDMEVDDSLPKVVESCNFTVLEAGIQYPKYTRNQSPDDPNLVNIGKDLGGFTTGNGTQRFRLHGDCFA